MQLKEKIFKTVDQDISTFDIAFLGVPYDSGAGSRKGTSFAPQYLRNLISRLPLITRDGTDISTVKVVDFNDIKIYSDDGHLTRHEIKKSISNLINTYSKPIISIGGDHSITYPIVSSFSENKNIGLIWFDAHPDLLDTFINSQYSHGCPLRRIIESQSVSSENVLLVGTRYYEGDEYSFIKDHSINEISMYDIENGDYINKFRNKIIELLQRVDCLYVSIDIDIIDPAYAPGTGSPVPIGLSPNRLLEFLSMVPSEKICGYDIVEYCPDADLNNITGKLILFILSEILKKYA